MELRTATLLPTFRVSFSVNVWLKTLWTDSIGKEIVNRPQSVKLYNFFFMINTNIHNKTAHCIVLIHANKKLASFVTHLSFMILFIMNNIL